MLQLMTNAEIDQAQECEDQIQGAIREAQAQNPVITALAAHIRTCWEAAKRAKNQVQQQILKNMRQKQGIYDPEKLAAIKAMKSCEVFMKITDVKCPHAKHWIQDILFQPGTTP